MANTEFAEEVDHLECVCSDWLDQSADEIHLFWWQYEDKIKEAVSKELYERAKAILNDRLEEFDFPAMRAVMDDLANAGINCCVSSLYTYAVLNCLRIRLHKMTENDDSYMFED